MERRVLLAITLSFLVLFLFQRFVMPPPAPKPASANQSAASANSNPIPASAPALGSGATAGQAQVPAAPVAIAPAASAEVILGDTADREIAVDTETVHAVFTNRGGRLVHWTLKKYSNDLGAPLELVPGGAGPEAIKPFTLAVDDAAITRLLNNSLYQVNNGVTGGSGALTFELKTSDGLTAKKTFIFQPTGYVMTFSPIVERGGQRLNPTVQWGPGLGDDIARAKPASFFSPSYNTPAQAIVHVDGKVQRLAVTTAGSQEGTNLYAGIDDHYFVSMLLNDESPAPFQFQHAPNVVPSTTEPGMTGRYIDYAVRYQAPRDNMRFYVGPKSLDELRGISTEMVRVINYGIFSWLAVPLLGGLKWVHEFIGNWG